jgi:hypothetical protein
MYTCNKPACIQVSMYGHWKTWKKEVLYEFGFQFNKIFTIFGRFYVVAYCGESILIVSFRTESHNSEWFIAKSCNSNYSAKSLRINHSGESLFTVLLILKVAISYYLQCLNSRESVLLSIVCSAGYVGLGSYKLVLSVLKVQHNGWFFPSKRVPQRLIHNPKAVLNRNLNSLIYSNLNLNSNICAKRP